MKEFHKMCKGMDDHLRYSNIEDYVITKHKNKGIHKDKDINIEINITGFFKAKHEIFELMGKSPSKMY